MFNKLTVLDYKRSTKESIGFYIAYVFLGTIIAALLGAILAGNSYSSGLVLGQKFAILFTIFMALYILKSKNQLQNFSFLIITLFSGLLAVVGGLLLGMLPVAYLTTKAKQTKSKKRK